MQYERVSLFAQFGHDDLNTLSHQPADEVKAVELRYHDGRTKGAAGAKGGGELGTAVQCVRTLTRLHFAEPVDDSICSRLAKARIAAFWASRPNPERPCSFDETRT
jgi:hypothetical protein